MKRLVLILFLSFSTVTFFANEKSEALPGENEVEAPNFSVRRRIQKYQKTGTARKKSFEGITGI